MSTKKKGNTYTIEDTKKGKANAKPVEEIKNPASNYDRTEEIKQMFKLFDKDGNGQISSEEVGSLLTALGRNPTEEEINNLIAECDKDNSGTVDLSEFTKFMNENYVASPEAIETVVEAFKFFDLDNNGWISCEEFKNILMKYGGEFTEKEVEQIFRESDLDGDGKLQYAEFTELWKYQ
jgi:calmodulin